MLKKYRVWEGRRFGKGKGNYQTVRFVGEDIGYWSEGHPTTHERGTSYRIFRTEAGFILIHRIRWSRWSTEDDVGDIFLFADINDAAAKFHRVLQNARVI